MFFSSKKTVQAYLTLKRFPHMFPCEFSEKILGMLSESLNLSFELSKEGDSLLRKWSNVRTDHNHYGNSFQCIVDTF